MSFNIFQPVLRVATEQDVQGRWGAGAPGERFRCGLCGHRLQVGDRWRAVMANGARPDDPESPTCRYGNFLVCAACHDCAGGQDTVLLEKRAQMEAELETRFWWVRRG